MAKITIAAYGICNPAWNSNYYPEDLPDDWKLAYFANDFSACLLTPGDLSILGANSTEFVANLPDGFRFFLEIRDQGLPDIGETLLEKVAGFVLLSTSAPDALLEKFIRDSGKPVCAFSVQNSPERVKMDHDDFALPPCHTSSTNAHLNCIVISTAEAKDLRQLKRRLSGLLQNDNDELILFVDGGPDIDAIRNVSVLIQLLT